MLNKIQVIVDEQKQNGQFILTGVTSTTISEWISILESSFIIFRLEPYFENFTKRLVKSPKIYFYDTGLACYLLGIKNAVNPTVVYSGNLECESDGVKYLNFKNCGNLLK